MFRFTGKWQLCLFHVSSHQIVRSVQSDWQCFPMFSIVFPYFPLFSIELLSDCRTKKFLLTMFSLCFLMFSIVFHCFPLFSIVFHWTALWFSLIVEQINFRWQCSAFHGQCWHKSANHLEIKACHSKYVSDISQIYLWQN